MKAVYLVYPSRGTWWVDFDGFATGPYGSRAAAISEAIPMAQQMQRSGRPAEVLAPGDDKRHYVAWPATTVRRRTDTAIAS
jgi:hypothetical protein